MKYEERKKIYRAAIDAWGVEKRVEQGIARKIERLRRRIESQR